MPRPASWLPRLSEIRQSVNNSQRSHYTRRDLELLFKSSPRAAGKLLELLATDRAGSSHLVSRQALQSFLDLVRETENVPGLVGQIRAEKENITRVRARYMHLADSADLRDASLPANVSLERGELRIKFGTAVELVENMVQIAGMLDADPVSFERRFEPIPAELPDAADARWIQSEIERMDAADLYRNAEKPPAEAGGNQP